MTFPLLIDEFREIQSLLDEMITMVLCSDGLTRGGLVGIGDLSIGSHQFGVFVVNRCFVIGSGVLVEPDWRIDSIVAIPVRGEEGGEGVIEFWRGRNLCGMGVGEIVDVVVARFESLRHRRKNEKVVGIRERRETGRGEQRGEIRKCGKKVGVERSC